MARVRGDIRERDLRAIGELYDRASLAGSTRRHRAVAPRACSGQGWPAERAAMTPRERSAPGKSQTRGDPWVRSARYVCAQDGRGRAAIGGRRIRLARVGAPGTDGHPCAKRTAPVELERGRRTRAHAGWTAPIEPGQGRAPACTGGIRGSLRAGALWLLTVLTAGEWVFLRVWDSSGAEHLVRSR